MEIGQQVFYVGHNIQNRPLICKGVITKWCGGESWLIKEYLGDRHKGVARSKSGIFTSYEEAALEASQWIDHQIQELETYKNDLLKRGS